MWFNSKHGRLDSLAAEGDRAAPNPSLSVLFRLCPFLSLSVSVSLCTVWRLHDVYTPSYMPPSEYARTHSEQTQMSESLEHSTFIILVPSLRMNSMEQLGRFQT